MEKFDIYAGNDEIEATACGPIWSYEGLNPADALMRFRQDERFAYEIRSLDDKVTNITAYNGEMNAVLWFDSDGSMELHLYIGDSDIAITLPPMDYMSVSDAAWELDVNHYRVRQLIESGKLNARKVSGDYIVSCASVESRRNENPPGSWAGEL